MATDAKELERVRRIHYWLDYLAKTGVADSGADINDGAKNHSYTAAEVRAWPEMKAKLTHRMFSAPSELSVAVWISHDLTSIKSVGVWGPDAAMHDKNKAQVARGLCMYREQLSDALSPGRALTEDGSVRVNEEQAEALTFRGIDPASDAEPEFKVECHKFNDEHARKLTDTLPANVAARARNIAALAAELSTPVTPRFPAEGRSDRALSVTNGMIRGRE